MAQLVHVLEARPELGEAHGGGSVLLEALFVAQRRLQPRHHADQHAQDASYELQRRRVGAAGRGEDRGRDDGVQGHRHHRQPARATAVQVTQVIMRYGIDPHST
eukprot:CAMPEP_0179140866 /NCGR_PEP_ID=MMETSP0796-20121207/67503_1 /TAXON_ID=73915 /ORGANISM="Pyrodinium bahamense, Strain pbaha01" /LENGTH=103 /DNA_ID=CAMNT_0020840495 /DNA_START=498 /DNA_END=805 /DNA_ORIENTATION=+